MHGKDKNHGWNNVWKSLLQIATRGYYKLRELTLLQIATRVITNCDRYVITNCDKFYYKLRQVLQIATTVITNCDRYYKLRQYTLFADDTAIYYTFLNQNLDRLAPVVDVLAWTYIKHL